MSQVYITVRRPMHADASHSNRQSAAAYAEASSDYTFGDPSPIVVGRVLHNINIVVVRWKWIAAHAVFTVISLLLLVVTITLQHFSRLKGEAWKTSSLAVLHALDPDLQRQLAGIDKAIDMGSRDGRLAVRLQRMPDDGWRLFGSGKDQVALNEL